MFNQFCRVGTHIERFIHSFTLSQPLPQPNSYHSQSLYLIIHHAPLHTLFHTRPMHTGTIYPLYIYTLHILFLLVFPYTYTRPGTSLCAFLVLFFLSFSLILTLYPASPRICSIFHKNYIGVEGFQFSLKFSSVCTL